MKTLGGSTFIYNGNKFDYNYRETITCLKDICDVVTVCVIRSDDGTLEEVLKFEDDKCKVIILDDELWNKTTGKDRLSYFSNIAISNQRTDWDLYVQCDEIVTEDSVPYIRQAINSNIDCDSFMMQRHNLWGSPYTKLIAENQPCSINVIRLAKSDLRCYDDGESKRVHNLSFAFNEKIQMMHMGFVRDIKVMKSKVINMQRDVFGMDYDKKLDKSELYDPWDYFTRDQVVPIDKPLPKWIAKWASERNPQ